MSKIRVCHVNAYEAFGGSAKAALRLHQALTNHTPTDSRLYVTYPQHNYEGVHSLHHPSQKLWLKVQPHISPLLLRAQSSSNPVIHTLAWPPTGLGSNIIHKARTNQIDIVHLHFLGNSTITVSEIGQLQKYVNVVWTLHDEWPYSGSEHYSYPFTADPLSLNRRYITGYTSANRLDSDHGLDIDKYLWRHKCRSWSSEFSLICPSRWIQKTARNSRLMSNCKSIHIPNAIDTTFWCPIPTNSARSALDLPQDCRIILFGATGGSLDQRKGWDLLKAALNLLKQYIEECRDPLANKLALCIFGQSCPIKDLPFPVHNLGILSDELSLRLVYSSADVFVLPSRIDNLPTTGIEAQCCGLPVVAFSVGGLEDVVAHNQTGFLSDPFSAKSLAKSIYRVLQNDINRKFSNEARLRALRLWSDDAIAKKHHSYYMSLLES